MWITREPFVPQNYLGLAQTHTHTERERNSNAINYFLSSELRPLHIRRSYKKHQPFQGYYIAERNKPIMEPCPRELPVEYRNDHTRNAREENVSGGRNLARLHPTHKFQRDGIDDLEIHAPLEYKTPTEESKETLRRSTPREPLLPSETPGTRVSPTPSSEFSCVQ